MDQQGSCIHLFQHDHFDNRVTVKELCLAEDISIPTKRPGTYHCVAAVCHLWPPFPCSDLGGTCVHMTFRAASPHTHAHSAQLYIQLCRVHGHSNVTGDEITSHLPYHHVTTSMTAAVSVVSASYRQPVSGPQTSTALCHLATPPHHPALPQSLVQAQNTFWLARLAAVGGQHLKACQRP